MTDIDISPEAVEHLCAIHEDYEQHGTVATLRALSTALTQSRAETAAAYEVAATCTEWTAWGERHNLTDASRAAIRALATPDQTAALDKLIAEAVGPYVDALIWCSGSADFNDGGFAREGWLKLCARLLSASKKGGV